MKKTVSGLMLTLLLVGMLTLAFGNHSVRAKSKPTIGFYGINFEIYQDSFVPYLKTLGYNVLAVNELNFTYADAIYIDFRAIYPLTEEDLLEYVENGGSLWVGGEAVGGTFLGITISAESIWFVGSLLDPRVWIREHPVLKDVKSIAYPAGAWIEIAGNIEEIVCIDGKPILAVDYSRLGKILWLIDSDIFGQYFLNDEDNSILASNIAAWLTTPTHEIVETAVDINPDALNLKSKGKWVTGYIELPEGYNVGDIDVSTIMLNDTISAELTPVGIGDEDADGDPDLMVKFSRREAICHILHTIDFPESTTFIDVSLTITAELTDGTLFEGSDTTRIIIPKQMSSMSNHIQI